MDTSKQSEGLEILELELIYKKTKGRRTNWEIKFMAKVKNPLKSLGNTSLIYTKRKESKEGYTHNVRVKRLKSKKK